jgi:hypothetical protein
MNATESAQSELSKLKGLHRELAHQLAALDEKLAELARSQPKTEERPFMRLAGSIQGPPDLSEQRPFEDR